MLIFAPRNISCYYLGHGSNINYPCLVKCQGRGFILSDSVIDVTVRLLFGSSAPNKSKM